MIIWRSSKSISTLVTSQKIGVPSSGLLGRHICFLEGLLTHEHRRCLVHVLIAYHLCSPPGTGLAKHNDHFRILSIPGGVKIFNFMQRVF